MEGATSFGLGVLKVGGFLKGDTKEVAPTADRAGTWGKQANHVGKGNCKRARGEDINLKKREYS